jgi:hypothetical protein
LSDGLAPMYRMPVSFGPAPGPRNIPAEHRRRRYEKRIVSLTLAATTDGDELARLLPEGFELDGEPRLEVIVSWLSDIGWLAGRGYNIVLVRIPARWRGRDEVSGYFVPVVWESMADPILTGRDELGWPKIYADIPEPVVDAGDWRACAAWDGFEFLSVSAGDFSPSEAPPVGGPLMFHKYVPRTGEWGEAEIDYFTATAPDGPAPRLDAASLGTGTFRFNAARWEDMPTQYPIVAALAALPLTGFLPATITEVTGGGDASGQRRLT